MIVFTWDVKRFLMRSPKKFTPAPYLYPIYNNPLTHNPLAFKWFLFYFPSSVRFPSLLLSLLKVLLPNKE